MRSALVTGGAGFLGSHLVDALVARGLSVWVLDDLSTGSRDNLPASEPRLRFLEHDVRSPFPAEVLAQRFDQVFNLASPASPRHYGVDPVRTLMTNVVGTERALDVAAASGARFFQASTSEIYGQADEHPQRESTPGVLDPSSPRACYAEGKRAAEALCFDYARAGRVDVRVARLFNTYGPRMALDDGRVITNLLCQALRGEALTLHGDGLQTRSFCFVDDMIRGILAWIKSDDARGPLNLGNAEEVSIAALAEKVVACVGGESRLRYLPLPAGDPSRRCPDMKRARELLGFTPRIGLDVGLRRTAEALRLCLARQDAA